MGLTFPKNASKIHAQVQRFSLETNQKLAAGLVYGHSRGSEHRAQVCTLGGDSGRQRPPRLGEQSPPSRAQGQAVRDRGACTRGLHTRHSPTTGQGQAVRDRGACTRGRVSQDSACGHLGSSPGPRSGSRAGRRGSTLEQRGPRPDLGAPPPASWGSDPTP